MLGPCIHFRQTSKNFFSVSKGPDRHIVKFKIGDDNLIVSEHQKLAISVWAFPGEPIEDLSLWAVPNYELFMGFFVVSLHDEGVVEC